MPDSDCVEAPRGNVPTVLFVCTGNAGRSQMAEAMFRRLAAGRAHVMSAGVDPWPALHPMAVKLMAERDLDLAGHHPKPVSAHAGVQIDAVVTLGDPARELLPDRLKNESRWQHWDVSDPADADGTDNSEAVFRRTAEMIEKRLPDLLQQVSSPTNPSQ